MNIYGSTFNEFNAPIQIQNPDRPTGLHSLLSKTCPGAAFDSLEREPHPKCHPGTRLEILMEIKDKLKPHGRTGEKSQPVLWIHGPAGVGKSAIAQTVAIKYHEQGKLAASFFFSRHSSGRNSVTRFIPTIAYQLAVSIPLARGGIQEQYESDPSIISKSLSTQVQRLILEPLQYIRTAPLDSPKIPDILIIDGLDECCDRGEQTKILECVRHLVSYPSFPLRVIIVSRLEPTIQHAVDEHLANYVSQIVVYGDHRSRDDVRTFLLSEFARISSSRRDTTLMPLVLGSLPPKSKAVIDTLMDRSDGFFIYASTLVRFVDQEFHSPSKQLRIILNQYHDLGSVIFGELDKLYFQILSAAHHEKRLVKLVIEAALCRFPNSLIPIILERDPGEVSIVLQNLQSIFQPFKLYPWGLEFGAIPIAGFAINNPDDLPGSRPTHTSFSDFLLDSKRSGQYYINQNVQPKQTVDIILYCFKCFCRPAERTLSPTDCSLPLPTFFLSLFMVLFDTVFGSNSACQPTLCHKISSFDPALWSPLSPNPQSLPWRQPELMDQIISAYILNMSGVKILGYLPLLEAYSVQVLSLMIQLILPSRDSDTVSVTPSVLMTSYAHPGRVPRHGRKSMSYIVKGMDKFAKSVSLSARQRRSTEWLLLLFAAYMDYFCRRRKPSELQFSNSPLHLPMIDWLPASFNLPRPFTIYTQQLLTVAAKMQDLDKFFSLAFSERIVESHKIFLEFDDIIYGVPDLSFTSLETSMSSRTNKILPEFITYSAYVQCIINLLSKLCSVKQKLKEGHKFEYLLVEAISLVHFLQLPRELYELDEEKLARLLGEVWKFTQKHIQLNRPIRILQWVKGLSRSTDSKLINDVFLLREESKLAFRTALNKRLESQRNWTAANRREEAKRRSETAKLQTITNSVTEIPDWDNAHRGGTLEFKVYRTAA